MFVALCDNANQGIVPVPARFGNGRDLANNLYWGAAYGVKTFLSRSAHWKRLSASPLDIPGVLERVILSSRSGPTVKMVADAYDGARMDLALTHFLESAAGERLVSMGHDRHETPDLVAFVGHNGLMDRALSALPKYQGRVNPSAAVVLACKSKPYFDQPLRIANCSPLVVTTGLMAPEAYVLDAVLRAWASGEPVEAVRRKAAEAYASYQRCSVGAALRLFGG